MRLLIKNQKTTHRIAKLMARSGIASRRSSEKLILAGRVKVNGLLVVSPVINISIHDKISVDGKLLRNTEKVRVWMYNKPTGLVSTTSDEKNRTTIFDMLPTNLPSVISIGRLDMNSEGLLLLTNNGDFKRFMELPKNNWARVYRVRVYGRKLDHSRLEPIVNGITVDGVHFKPMKITIEKSLNTNSWLKVSLLEGKNREVRKVFQAIGLTVNRLIRISYGPFMLGELEQGRVREVEMPTALKKFSNSIDL